MVHQDQGYFDKCAMHPSPINSIKREEIDNKWLIHALTMNNKDKYQSSFKKEPPYKMCWVHKTR